MAKTYAEQTYEERYAEFMRYLDEVSRPRPKAEVFEFPDKLSGADRLRQEQVAEQDRLRLAEYHRQERLNLWWYEERQSAERAKRDQGCEYHPYQRLAAYAKESGHE
jgi:hypothetical protein